VRDRLEGLPGERIEIVDRLTPGTFADIAATGASTDDDAYCALLLPGDELGVDALLGARRGKASRRRLPLQRRAVPQSRLRHRRRVLQAANGRPICCCPTNYIGRLSLCVGRIAAFARGLQRGASRSRRIRSGPALHRSGHGYPPCPAVLCERAADGRGKGKRVHRALARRDIAGDCRAGRRRGQPADASAAGTGIDRDPDLHRRRDEEVAAAILKRLRRPQAGTSLDTQIMYESKDLCRSGRPYHAAW
jgi:hypothetical protein